MESGARVSTSFNISCWNGKSGWQIHSIGSTPARRELRNIYFVFLSHLNAAINPCSRSVCHANAACAHTGPNQHVCTCAKGYSGDGRVCMPIDPCQTNFGDCPSSSTRCVYDGPGKVSVLKWYSATHTRFVPFPPYCDPFGLYFKSHCECLEGFSQYVERMGCSIKDVCRPDSCHKYATCATVVPGTVE